MRIAKADIPKLIGRTQYIINHNKCKLASAIRTEIEELVSDGVRPSYHTGSARSCALTDFAIVPKAIVKYHLMVFCSILRASMDALPSHHTFACLQEATGNNICQINMSCGRLKALKQVIARQHLSEIL